MVVCPHCQAEISTDDFGVMNCPQCQASFFVDLDGNAKAPESEEVLDTPAGEIQNETLEEEIVETPQETPLDEPVENLEEELEENAQPEMEENLEEQTEENLEEESEEQSPEDAQDDEVKTQDSKQVDFNETDETNKEDQSHFLDKWEKTFFSVLKGEKSYTDLTFSMEKMQGADYDPENDMFYVRVEFLNSVKKLSLLENILSEKRLNLEAKTLISQVEKEQLIIPSLNSAQALYLCHVLHKNGFKFSWKS